MTFHLAVNYSYAELVSGLDVEVAKGYVNRTVGPDGLVLYNYTNSCVYDKAWNAFTLIARGIVLDTIEHEVVALPFPKFFNYGEGGTEIPDLPFEAYEKMDGSLIIIYYHKNKWRCNTRGSFYSDQAKWAEDQLQKYVKYLDEGNTYLFEAIYTANRIVVKYDYEDLVLLGGYDVDGEEFSTNNLDALSIVLNCKKAKSYKFNSFADILAKCPELTRNEEGFVVRFSNGLRLKIKGDEYKRIHRMVSNLSPLSIWESMLAKSDLLAIRKELPEEFWEDFDKIFFIFHEKQKNVTEEIGYYFAKTGNMTNKEIGLSKEIPSDIKSYLFNSRSGREDKNYEKILNSMRPTGNYLEGYSASSSLKEAQSDT